MLRDIYKQLIENERLLSHLRNRSKFWKIFRNLFVITTKSVALNLKFVCCVCYLRLIVKITKIILRYVYV